MRFITKNILRHSFLLFLLISVLFSCNNADKISTDNNNDKAKADTKPVQPAIILASMNAIAPDSVRKNFKNLISVADCTSPLGKYTTQVNSDSGGYMYFKQVFSYGPEPFEAVLLKDSGWYNLSDTVDRLARPLVFTVRSHAFHNLLLELQQRFHDFEDAGTFELQSKLLHKVKAKDAPGRYNAFYFDTINKRLSVWEYIAPNRRSDTIFVRFSDWRNTGQFNLPFRVEIEQAKQQFVFNYNKIEINSPEFKRIMLSPGKLSRRSGKKK